MKKAYLGIDVSKGYMDSCVLDDAGQVAKKYTKLYDTKAHHEKLKVHISLLLSQDYQHIYCGVESTGGYENNWYRTLSQDAFSGRVTVIRINPKRIHHESMSVLTRTVSDPVAAHTIADHLRKNLATLIKHPAPSVEMYCARKYYKHVSLLQKQLNQLSNHLEKAIYENIPELTSWCKNGVPIWLLELIKQYPSKDKIKRAHVQTMSKIKGLTQDVSLKIKQKVKDGIGSESNIYTAHLLTSLADEILLVKRKIKSEKDFLFKNYQDPNIELLTSIPGIGIQSAVTILLEIEDVSRFESGAKLATYFGLIPVYKSSGDKTGKTKMSKSGRASFRNIMYNVARNSVNHSTYFAAIYQKFRAKGMGYNQAIGVMMHKLTRVVFGVLNSGKLFDLTIDQKNMEKSCQKKKTEKENKIILEKEKEELILAQSAPCSSRYVKKQKVKTRPKDQSLIKNEVTEFSPVQT